MRPVPTRVVSQRELVGLRATSTGALRGTACFISGDRFDNSVQLWLVSVVAAMMNRRRPAERWVSKTALSWRSSS